MLPLPTCMQWANMAWLLRKIKFYVVINSFICTIAAATYWLAAQATETSLLSVLGLRYLGVVVRIFGVLAWFQWISSFKDVIHGEKRSAPSSAQNMVILARIFCIVVPTEVVSASIGIYFNPSSDADYWSYLEAYVYFIPKSLVLEVIFDLFHYAAHYICHIVPSLYKHVHKRHHLHLHPTPLSTYEQDGVDLVLTNVLPMTLAFLLGPSVSPTQLQLVLAYKTYVEIAGHSGLDIKGFSFPQMPLLSSSSICLRVHDHDLHHTHPNYNFAKRFSLWDKLFKTFKAPTTVSAAAY
ncbi:hypothetical protein SDRG_02603 [Saprolegnia diclina VS20]|uniref:Fatty acid hydroxylase domain-containing protein n=1 Tax=Saprolegnia diclina (strain VS20) TaxID=1156394 RepID=T0SAT8_SAPDV|nr:hypothetical protein SDRG_02603 [Saprolegnia diclina VS20]EQC39947.1 hypothetical protein SDRG_02603 [Saprolegnia diclina VS20]|eukprot:XP_008606421.1 hypothetical protein SDRG_02603 [Saprolegnia diclina VS20]